MPATPPSRSVRLVPEEELPELSPRAAAVLLRILRKEHERTATEARTEAA